MTTQNPHYSSFSPPAIAEIDGQISNLPQGLWWVEPPFFESGFSPPNPQREKCILKCQAVQPRNNKKRQDEIYVWNFIWLVMVGGFNPFEKY